MGKDTSEQCGPDAATDWFNSLLAVLKERKPEQASLTSLTSSVA